MHPSLIISVEHSNVRLKEGFAAPARRPDSVKVFLPGRPAFVCEEKDGEAVSSDHIRNSPARPRVSTSAAASGLVGESKSVSAKRSATGRKAPAILTRALVLHKCVPSDAR